MRKLNSLWEKGFVLKVDSWENDGDNDRTEFYDGVETIEEAEAIKKMCDTLFLSGGKYGIGNSQDQEEWVSPILAFVADFPNESRILFNCDIHKLNIEHLGGEELTDDQQDVITEIMDQIDDYARSLLGTSEYYACRVCEGCEIFDNN